MDRHFLSNLLNPDKYKSHSEAIVISCFFNPQNSPYRLRAFNIFYDSIKHLNHKIIECIIGDTGPQLEENKNIERVYTKNLLWHKESLLNNIIKKLPKKYKYVFWVDADLIFTNKNWLYHGSKILKKSNVIQPFEFCVHLEKDEIKPSFNIEEEKKRVFTLERKNIRLWRSFCANYSTTKFSDHKNYDLHGHVGFAWGAKREVLEKTPLYERALIGGADHIMAHAGAGHICHNCIKNSFTEDLESIIKWSKTFFGSVKGEISFVRGDVFHIWHGDIAKRQYLQRIKDFTEKSKSIINKDENGLYIISTEDDEYVKNYFKIREVTETI